MFVTLVYAGHDFSRAWRQQKVYDPHEKPYDKLKPLLQSDKFFSVHPYPNSTVMCFATLDMKAVLRAAATKGGQLTTNDPAAAK